MRRTSPSTRIIGGRPADKCKSEALFFTEKASSSAISIWFPLEPNHLDGKRPGGRRFSPDAATRRVGAEPCDRSVPRSQAAGRYYSPRGPRHQSFLWP